MKTATGFWKLLGLLVKITSKEYWDVAELKHVLTFTKLVKVKGVTKIRKLFEFIASFGVSYGCWMLQKQKFIWYEKIFLFNQNKFVYNKVYFHYITVFSRYQDIFSFSQNKSIFSNKHFYHVYIFFHSIKIYFYHMSFSLNTFLVSIAGLPFVFKKVRILLSVCKLNNSMKMWKSC